MSCGVGHRCGSDLVFLWLWHRPAAAVPIQPLAWELPYDVGTALKTKKKKKKKKRKKRKKKEKILRAFKPREIMMSTVQREK